jgi:hypothetical protein
MKNRETFESRGNVAVAVDDLMQQGYSYTLTEPEGENFHTGFRPGLTPAEMLELGVCFCRQ